MDTSYRKSHRTTQASGWSEFLFLLRGSDLMKTRMSAHIMSEILILTTDTSDSQEEHDRAKLRMDTLASHTVACVSLGPTS